ncbi:MAG: ABC transporter permease [Desulfovibrionales bacterium]
MRSSWSRWAAYAGTVAALYLLWKIAAVQTGSAVLPHPEEVFAAFGQALFTAAFWGHFSSSGFRAVSAMAIAWAIGFPLGILMGGSKRIDAVLSPAVFLTYPIPKIVLLPVVLLLFGLGDLSKVVMISLILGYQVLVTTRDGVRTIPGQYLDSVRSLGASKPQIVTEVLVPGALPHGFTALRLNSGVSVAVLFFVESFATQQGLGYLIMDAWGRLDYQEMFVGIFGMSLLGVLLYEAANRLERISCRWRFCS